MSSLHISGFACIKKEKTKADRLKLISVLEIMFIYSQDIYPFKSSFWPDIWQNRTISLLTENTLKITQNVPVRYSVIVSDHNVKLAGYLQNLVRQFPMTDYYFQYSDIYMLQNIS